MEFMDEGSERSGNGRWMAVWGVLRPSVPAVIGAAALTFLFAAVMPVAWVAGISWNLYLDRLSDFFLPPVGNAARLILALAMAAVAALIAGFIALIVAQPEESGLAALRRRAKRRSAGDDDVPVRRRADLHPDDLPRAPIRAGRDLPAEGLVPSVVTAEPVVDAADWPIDDELILADLAPLDLDEPGAEPWLQPVEIAGPALPDPADNSLGAMVARLEAGLSRRRQPQAAAPAIPVPGTPQDQGGEEEIDFALEAALSTLQRMNRQANG
jgi:hypothetical protein